jgi:hypothetical protein
VVEGNGTLKVGWNAWGIEAWKTNYMYDWEDFIVASTITTVFEDTIVIVFTN